MTGQEVGIISSSLVSRELPCKVSPWELLNVAGIVEHGIVSCLRVACRLLGKERRRIPVG